MRALRLPSLATLRAFRPTRGQLMGIGVAILVPSAWLLARGPAATDNSLVARVKRGPFAVTVTTSGELRARSSSKSPPLYRLRGATLFDFAAGRPIRGW